MFQEQKAGGQDQKDSSVLWTLVLPAPAPTSSQQPLPHLEGRKVAVALGGIVPRMVTVGVGNYIKGLELFRNLYASHQQTSEPEGHSRPVETVEQ